MSGKWVFARMCARVGWHCTNVEEIEMNFQNDINEEDYDADDDDL